MKDEETQEHLAALIVALRDMVRTAGHDLIEIRGKAELLALARSGALHA